MQESNNVALKKSKWYRQWWGILSIIAGVIFILPGLLLMIIIGVTIGTPDTTPQSTSNNQAIQQEQKQYTVSRIKNIGSTKMYVVYTNPEYRDASKLKSISEQIFNDLDKSEDFIVKVFDVELAASFSVDVPQSEWKRTAKQDDYAYVAEHQYGLLSFNKEANRQTTSFYANGIHGDRLEL